MHTALGFYVLAMVVTCTILLLICWAHGGYRVEIEAGRSDPADLEFADSSSRKAISYQIGLQFREAGRPFGGFPAKRRVYFVEGRAVWVRSRSAYWCD